MGGGGVKVEGLFGLVVSMQRIVPSKINSLGLGYHLVIPQSILRLGILAQVPVSEWKGRS